MAEAFVLQTLRTARTKSSPRGGLAGVSPTDLLVSPQRGRVRRTGLLVSPQRGRVRRTGLAVLAERVAS